MVIDTFLLYQKNSKTQDETMCHSTYYRKNVTNGTGDMSRHRKDSFYWYKKVIATNGGDLT